MVTDGYERAFRVAFAASASPMGLIDDDRVYRLVNPAACRLLGYAPDDMIGQRLEFFYDAPADRAQVLDGWDRFLEEGDAAGDVTFRAADGEQIHVHYHRQGAVLPGLHLGVILLDPQPVVVNDDKVRPPLTARETEVVYLIAEGLTSDEIGTALHISTDTARTHVRNAMEKQRARTRAHLIALAFGQGILRP